MNQGCQIGIPKNPDIFGSSRKSSLGAAEEPKRFTRRARNSASLKSGGVVAELSMKKSVDSSKNHFLSIAYHDLDSVQWGGGW